VPGLLAVFGEGIDVEGEYIPSKAQWVRDQVELYEGSNGAEGTTLRETGLSVVIVTNRGHRTGGVRKTPLMRVADGDNYVLVASQGGAPKHPSWYFNFKANPDVEIRDESNVYSMRVREIEDSAERRRLWDLAVEAFPPYAEYQEKTSRVIPVFLAERTG
jgi:F420H(2)-dependent quinone reductase